MTIGKKELIKLMQDKCPEFTQADCDKAIKAVVTSIIDTVRSGNIVTLTGFGSFRVKTIAARRGVNPYNGEGIDLPDRQKMVFRISPVLRKVMNPTAK